MKATKTVYGVFTKTGLLCSVAGSMEEALAYFPFGECDHEHDIFTMSESEAASGADRF